MLATIHLNDELVFQTDKIEDIIAERMLTAELDTVHLATPQDAP